MSALALLTTHHSDGGVIWTSPMMGRVLIEQAPPFWHTRNKESSQAFRKSISLRINESTFLKAAAARDSAPEIRERSCEAAKSWASSAVPKVAAAMAALA